MKRFEDQKVVVTGSSEGVGRDIAIGYAREGAHVLLVNRRKPDETMQLIEETGGTSDYLICDIGDEQQIKAMATEAGKKLDGKVDILMNNAGFNGKVSLVKDMNLSDWDYTIRVNLTGTMLVCREIIPYLINNGSGKVVNMASNVGKRGLPLRADYVCGKWALLGFTQTLALELVDYNVRVNAVCPGPIEGDRIEQIVAMHAEVEGISHEEMHKAWENVPMKRFVTPREVTDIVLFLSSEESSAMTGQALNITGGFLMN